MEENMYLDNSQKVQHFRRNRNLHHLIYFEAWLFPITIIFHKVTFGNTQIGSTVKALISIFKRADKYVAFVQMGDFSGWIWNSGFFKVKLHRFWSNFKVKLINLINFAPSPRPPLSGSYWCLSPISDCDRNDTFL